MNHTRALDEYLDLVDENDNVVGKKKRSEVYAVLFREIISSPEELIKRLK